jgi:hypothetical protein
LKLSEGGFHPTTLVYFRQRLIEHAKADLAIRKDLAFILIAAPSSFSSASSEVLTKSTHWPQDAG